jgi:hypothetical protein
MAVPDPEDPKNAAADAADVESELARELARRRGESLEVLISELSAGSAGGRRA